MFLTGHRTAYLTHFRRKDRNVSEEITQYGLTRGEELASEQTNEVSKALATFKKFYDDEKYVIAEAVIFGAAGFIPFANAEDLVFCALELCGDSFYRGKTVSLIAAAQQYGAPLKAIFDWLSLFA
jgi:hypothetical protein